MNLNGMRRVLDILILLIFLLVLLPTSWWQSSSEPEELALSKAVPERLPLEEKIETPLPSEEKVEEVPAVLPPPEVVQDVPPDLPKPAVLAEVKKVPAPLPSPVLWLQLGVFRDQKSAQLLIQRLKKHRLPYRLLPMGSLYALQVGPLTSARLKSAEQGLREAGIRQWVKTAG